MRKYILVFGVIVIFAGYVIYSRNGGDNVKIVPPAGLTVPAAATAPLAAGSTATDATSQGQYKDGSYTSPVTNAYFGNLQIQVAVNGGKISDVAFLQYPNDNPNSINVNTQAMPYLKAEAIQAQSANVNIISGATQTSQAFQQALAAALGQAKN